MTLSEQLIFVLILFLIHLLPRVYKNFALTCIVYLAMILADNDQYFKQCAPSDRFCKIFNISLIITFGIHLIFGVLLIIADKKKRCILMLPWLLWWIVPTIGIVFIVSSNGYIYLAMAGWIAVMCLDIYLFKYKKYKECTDETKAMQVGDSLDTSELRLITAASGKFQQSDLWC